MGEIIGYGGKTERRELLPAALVTLELGVNESNKCGVAAELLDRGGVAYKIVVRR